MKFCLNEGRVNQTLHGLIADGPLQLYERMRCDRSVARLRREATAGNRRFLSLCDALAFHSSTS